MAEHRNDQAGIALRDWFAGMALQGMNSNDRIAREAAEVARKQGLDAHKVISIWAYRDADAMLQERDELQNQLWRKSNERHDI